MLKLKKLKSQNGQALVEYILIISLSVALILGLMNQFYAPFGKWLDNYLGKYLECLLDVGELPSLGGGETSGECNSKFSAFSITKGRQPSAKDPGKENSTNNAGSGGGKSSGSSESATSNPSSSSQRRNSSMDPFPNKGRAGADGGVSEGQSRQVIEPLPESSFMRFRSNSRAPVVLTSSAQSFRNPDFYTIAPSKSSQEAIEEKGKPVVIDDSGSSKKIKKIVIQPSEKKNDKDNEVEESWDFSDYMRYGIIILIVVALVLFLIGQGAKISKSLEKN